MLFSQSSSASVDQGNRVVQIERILGIWLVAAIIAILQISYVVYFANHHKPLYDKYVSLVQHDSEWYAHIVDNGYMLRHFPLEVEGNTMAHVGFFPGYPFATWILKMVTGATTTLSLLITAQLFTIGVWAYIILFLNRYKVQWKLRTIALVAVFAFPSAFFFIAGYSESLFTFALLGYLYWMTDDRKYSWIFASAHGFVMSATRIVGIPLLVFPLVRHVLRTRRFPTQLQPYAVALFTGLGAASFFLYCQGAFGEWNIYSHAQSFGWGIKPDMQAIFKPEIYKIVIPFMSWDGFVDPDGVSRLSVPLIFGLAMIVLACEILTIIKNPRDPSKIDHILICAAAGGLFFVTVSGLEAVKMRSVIRYMLPPFILLIIVAASMLSEFRHWHSWKVRVLWGLFSIGVALMFFVQAGHIDLFSHRVWVA